DNRTNLQSVYRADSAIWQKDKVILSGDIEKDDLTRGKIVTTTQPSGEFTETENPFTGLGLKPAHLNTPELKVRIGTAESDVERRSLVVALEKKYTTLFLPLVMALFTSPFALSLSRKGKAATVGGAIGLWLIFAGVSNTFEQLGLNGVLSPQ